MSDEEFTQSELTIPELLSVLKRRRVIVFGSIALCFILALAYVIVATRRYQSVAEIQIQKSSSDGLGLESMMSSAGGDATDALDANISLQTQAAILQSDTLALKVIEDLHLESTQDFQPHFNFNPIGFVIGLLTPPGPRDPANSTLADAPALRTRLLKIFAANLTVKPVAGTRLIDISYLNPDPKIAAAVVNHLTEGLIDYTFQTRFNATTQASNWLSAQLDDLKKEAQNLQSRVVALQKESGVYSLGTSDATGKEMAYSATLDRLQQSTLSLTAATSNRIVKGGLYEIVKEGDPELISGLVGSSMVSSSSSVSNSLTLIQTLRGQQAALETQLATDNSRLGTANPKLGDEQASLAAINGQIKAEVVRIGQRAANDYHSAQTVEANLQADYDKQRAAANKVNDKAIEFMIAKQEAENSRTLYETLNSHLKEAGVMEGLHSSNITIVDPGRASSKPLKPNIPLSLAASLFGGVLLGGLGALFREATDDRIQSVEIIEGSLGTPIIAILPLVSSGSPRGASSYLPSTSATKMLLDPTASSSRFSRRLPAIDAPNTAFVESLRSLRTALLLSRSVSPPKVILVTSATEGEGKSTIAVNLAAVLAQGGRSVLLIEADMRRPGLSRLFHLDALGGTGLSSVLSGTSTEKQTQIEAFAEVPTLAVIPAGPLPPYPADLLGAKCMADQLKQWSKEYDFILIDSPPLLAVADAMILARLADVTLLIARHGVSTRKSLERAYRKLREADEKVSVVLNGVNRDSVSYGEYYGYKGSNYYSGE